MTIDKDPRSAAVLPVTVPGQDRILAQKADLVVAIVAVRAYPGAVAFQLLIRTRHSSGEPPNLAFDMPHLFAPGDFEIGAQGVNATGEDLSLPVHVGGGGGGGEGDESSFEFRMWFALPDECEEIAVWCSWEARGLGKTSAMLDLARIRMASEGCRLVWEDA